MACADRARQVRRRRPFARCGCWLMEYLARSEPPRRNLTAFRRSMGLIFDISPALGEQVPVRIIAELVGPPAVSQTPPYFLWELLWPISLKMSLSIFCGCSRRGAFSGHPRSSIPGFRRAEIRPFLLADMEPPEEILGQCIVSGSGSNSPAVSKVASCASAVYFLNSDQPITKSLDKRSHQVILLDCVIPAYPS